MERLLAIALPLAVFGGQRHPSKIELLGAILAGIVTVLVWGAGVAYLAYRAFVLREGQPLAPRLALGVPALVVWTSAVVLLSVWLVD